MDTTVNTAGLMTSSPRISRQPADAAPVEAKASAPEKVETPQAAPAVDRAQKPALKQAAPNSGLTTYTDQESGRLIGRVYDRKSGDVLVEFPPERAYRAVAEIQDQAASKPKKSISL
jgi:uncharacterized FlaG/YvyC family protein